MGSVSPVLIWFLIGLALIGVEFLAPGVIVIFFGLGAWVSALAVWLFPGITLTTQLAIFLIVSILAVIALRKTIAKRFFKNDEKSTSDLDVDYIGQEAEVVELIMPEDDGLVSFHGTNWRARSSHVIEVGARVYIEKHEGLTLYVSPLRDKE